MNYLRFVKIFGNRITDSNTWGKTLEQSYQLYKEKGEDQFLIELEDSEKFAEFCDEYYDFMREHWNACSASMWSSYEDFKTTHGKNERVYWIYLRNLAKQNKR